MLNAWHAPTSRPTKDIDLLARMENRVDTVLAAVRDVCKQEDEAAGLVFDADSLEGTVIREDADYQGVRVVFQAYLQNARVQMQIDIGFGDVVFPAATLTEYPTILDYPAPRLRGYSRETAIAEKFEAMVKLGQLNSRVKDFFDIWLLSQQFDFDGAVLASAVAKTFVNRKTVISPQPIALSRAFAEDPTKTAQWRGFLRKSRLQTVPAELGLITDALAAFLLPVATALTSEQSFNQLWHAPGPWQNR
jgi:hypothetical protein